MRRTLADFQDPTQCRIAPALRLCPTDARYIAVLNEAQERLITQGAFWGLFARYRAVTTDGLLVWPREVASILTIALNKCPLRSRNMFWEFRGLGIGVQTGGACSGSVPCGTSCGSSTSDVLDQGSIPVQTPITGVNSKVKVFRDLAVDEGTPILLLGYDGNGNWIRTIQSGVYEDGEVVLASAAGTLSTNIFSVITGVQKPITSGPIRVYAYDTVLLSLTLMAVYDYDITNPWFRVSIIPSLIGCTTNTPTCSYTVDIVAKLDFVPVRNPTDFMLISCIPAMKDMCQAIVSAESAPVGTQKDQIIASGMASARASLEMELRHYNGAPEDVLQVNGCAGVTREPIEQVV